MGLPIIFKRWFEKGVQGNDATVRHHPRTYPQSRRAAVSDRGYEETSIRAIVTKARVNQAAINYHFKGKDGLYREVLRMAFRALTKHQLAHAQEMKGMSRENALGEFIRHQLHPLEERGELSRHMRIFNWEAVRPTAVYRKLISEEAALVRRFLPKERLSSTQRDRLPSLGRRHRSGIKEAAV